jgi:uncharacterized protein with HEPN domain
MNDIRRLEDMQGAVKAIEAYAPATYEAFLSDDRVQDAIMFNLVIMGEAANHISDEFQAQHPSIPWAALIGTRNVIVHGYDQVKLPIVWDIIQTDLLSLKLEINSLLDL